MVPSNYYVWTRSGLCIAESQNAFQHDPVKGFRIEELELIDPRIGIGFRQALTGMGSNWTAEMKGTIHLRGFNPSSDNSGNIFGFDKAILDPNREFLERNGVTLR